MAPSLPLGEKPPLDGSLPPSALEGSAGRPLSLYVHVPFCSVRCGYCDFNTYTATELGGGGAQAEYAGQAVRELDLARRVLGAGEEADDGRPLHSVFFGGGTPSQLPAEDLAAILRAAVERFGLEPGAEVTMEANPDSVTREMLEAMAAEGLTRVSFGMQSAVPHVLRTLDRTHEPERLPVVTAWARELGLSASVDLIYGTPGESLGDWRRSLEEAIALETEHVSAYSLIIEDGTKLAARMRRGELPYPSDDEAADKYELADSLLTAAGFEWYEVSNFAKSEAERSRHNQAYWLGSDWWGVGPGAHSHVGGVRFWNAKHPTAYAQRLLAGESPSVGREVLTEEQRHVERVLLEIRMREGLDLAVVGPAGREKVAGLIARELVEPKAAFAGRLVLTLRGRLMADAVVRELLD
ncbi:radical SAM family heme chaperone HemW [Falsarthrobacter nasiphocae]|uniref:Heme chaperone HemW n=1 Tax=Falsarthrobacter nasiphocae TaxID=189863 RepID=A0AAE4C5H3_9MICC|nr:radical SAM family heme chaperone HemW [Falsarthrobacter nasiphocae]MDR6891067.1 oxygen-independent coproporphyrinogen-3 oxidase [Falsarthrobacter nasiphocae]